MRPQHITAENLHYRAYIFVVTWASMRPQHITAENLPSLAASLPRRFASMRPQHITAENAGVRWWAMENIPLQ